MTTDRKTNDAEMGDNLRIRKTIVDFLAAGLADLIYGA
jgi:hypothetical protein